MILAWQEKASMPFLLEFIIFDLILFKNKYGCFATYAYQYSRTLISNKFIWNYGWLA